MVGKNFHVYRKLSFVMPNNAAQQTGRETYGHVDNVRALPTASRLLQRLATKKAGNR
jgi:hypothetical protein